MTDARRLVLVGWALVVLVALLMLVFRGSAEAGPAIVFAVIAMAMSAWLWFRPSRAAWIVTLVLGALWLLQFAAYTVADVTDDEFEAAIFLTDVIAVVAGIAIVWGAIRGLREREATPARDAARG